jgi:hypothetical protein
LFYYLFVVQVSISWLTLFLGVVVLTANCYSACQNQDFLAEKCKAAQVNAIVCDVFFAGRVVFAVTTLAWNFIVVYVLFSVCRTHTISKLSYFNHSLACTLPGMANLIYWLINPITAEVAIMRLLGSAPKSLLCDQRRKSKVTGLSDLMTLFIDLGYLYCKQTKRAFNVFKNMLN